MFATHLLLSKLAARATPTDWSCVDLVTRSYVPGSDNESELDWAQVLDALGNTLSFLKETPQAPAEDPNWMRKPVRPKEATDFPKIQANV